MGYDVSSGSATVSYTLSAPGNTLVFATYMDNDYSLDSATYNGAAATGTVLNGRASLAYFSDVVATGDFEITIGGGFPAAGSSAYFIYELSGVDSSVPAVTATGGSITTAADDSYVVNFIGINNDEGDLAVPTSGSIVTKDGFADGNGSIGGGSVAGGSGVAAIAGSQTLGWQDFDGGFPQGEVSAAFAPIPEPSTVLLGGFGLLALIRRRRA
jgi:hypothetical protein